MGLENEWCELCHTEPAVRRYRNDRVCASCGEAGDYDDSLTPEEWIADDLAIAQYCHEAEYEERGEAAPPGPMDLYTVEEWGRLYRRRRSE